MADHAIGRVFVELDLDSTRYTKGQKRLYKDATSTALGIEENFKKLGIKSVAEMNLMRQKITNAYQGIANSSKATANDILRAEKAKNAQLRALNIQQYGEHKSIIDKIKKHWLASITAIYAAWRVLKRVMSEMKEVIWAAARYETLGVVMHVVGNNAGYTAKQMDELSISLQKQGIAMRESRQNLIMMTEAHIDLKNAQKLGRLAQDAAVIGMMNSSKAMENMIWGIQSANIRVLRTIGINVSFADSYQKMVDKLNSMNPAVKRTVMNLTDLEKVTARTNEVLEFAPRIMGTYEAAMDTAAKQALSLQRYWDNLKILAGTAFTPVFSQAIQDITGEISDLNGELKKNKEAMTEWGNELRKEIIKIEIIVYRLVSVYKKITGIWEAMPWNKLSPSDWFGWIGTGLDKLGGKYDEIIKKYREATSPGKHGSYTVTGTEEEKAKNKELSEQEKITNKILALKAQIKKIDYDASEEGKAAASAAKKIAENKLISLSNAAKAQKKLNDEEQAARLAAQKEEEALLKKREAGNTRLLELVRKAQVEKDQIGKTIFEKEKIRIESQRKMYEQAGLDRILIEQWVMNETIAAAEKQRIATEKQTEKAKKEAEKTAKQMVDMSKETAKAMEETFSDIFFDAIVGEMKSLREYMLSFLKAIARSLANMYAGQVTAGIMSYVANAATDSYGTTPVEDPYYGPYSSASSSPSMSNSMSQSAGTQAVTYNINAVDSKSFSQMVQDNPESVHVVVQKSLKNNTGVRNAIRRNAS